MKTRCSLLVLALYELNTKPISKGVLTINTNRLFVYGIFLDEFNRDAYGMSNPKYATVLDYATFGGTIVNAQKIEGAGLSLTGLTVDVDPRHWTRLDQLEGAYDREIVTTTRGEQVFMYVGK